MGDEHLLPKEARYGMPSADQVLINRQYTVGYSYLRKQPKWVLELIDKDSLVDNDVEREDSFRQDYRIPEVFRVHKDHYKGSGFDKGHLIASANKLNNEVINSETFLMSNMSPQYPSFNRGIWKTLEGKIRDLKTQNNILEVYCISGPLWSYGKLIEALEVGVEKEILIPIPHYFFKCILSESKSGSFRFYAFMIPNEEIKIKMHLSEFQVPTSHIEGYAGLLFWDNLRGENIGDKKDYKYKLWFD